MKYIAHSHSCTECKGASKGLCHAILTSFQNSKYVLPPIEFQTFRVFMYSLSLSFSGYKSQNLMILVFKYTNSCSRMQEMHSKRPKFQKFPGGNPPPSLLQIRALGNRAFGVRCLFSAYSSGLAAN